LEQTVSYKLLHLAASVPYGAPLVRLALYLGADVHSTDTMNSTALHYAAAKSNFESMRVLIHAGANIHHTNVKDHFPYEVLARDVSQSLSEFISSLVVI